ncbi:hypothetical protein JI735_27350 [Paenibacillus sonchi]|uniref:Uncharacterized protein n=1 Tax=Paenibacillus sonchi TaxID=373687 RepID=A0A974PB91_9BACL|nr:hypothetical protein [Paenibacillus sonchi]QQZ60203.1 hypothetical protein JI735_27350 [Paenibacillus sonchi]
MAWQHQTKESSAMQGIVERIRNHLIRSINRLPVRIPGGWIVKRASFTAKAPLSGAFLLLSLKKVKPFPSSSANSVGAQNTVKARNNIGAQKALPFI